MACRKKQYQDMGRYRDTMRKQKERYRNRNGACVYGKRPYSREEDEMILARNACDTAIAAMLCRSVGAIQSRRHRLGQIYGEKEEKMKKGDYAYTPRFCTVRIEDVFETREAAVKAGYTEPTHYEDGSYGILGKSLDQYHMEFAAFVKG